MKKESELRVLGKQFLDNLLFLVLSCVFVMFFLLANKVAAVEFEDPLKAYKGEIKKEAVAQPRAIYKVWGKNMAKRVMEGKADGVVIDKNGQVIGGDNNVSVNGAGNIVVRPGATVKGNIYNLSDTKNTNIIGLGK